MSDEDFNKKQEIVHDEKNAGTPHILGGGSHFDPNAKDVAVKTVFNADYAAAIAAAPLNPRSKESIQLYFACAVSFLCACANGYDGSLMTSINAMTFYQNKFNAGTTGSTTGIIFSIYTIGSMVGAFSAGPLADRFGRRIGMFVGGCVIVTGMAIISSANVKGQLIAGRFILGWGISIMTVAAPSYCVEIAPANWRGRMTGIYNCGWFGGAVPAAAVTFGTQYIKSDMSWRLPLILQGVPSIAVMCSVYFIPESPRWLMANGRESEALDFLIKYHGNNDPNSPMVALEIREFRENIATNASDKRWWDYRPLFITSNGRWRMLCVLMISVFGQFSGSGLGYFNTVIYNNLGYTDVATQLGLNLANQCVSAVCAVTAAFLSDRMPRRPVLIWSTFGCSILLAINGALSYRWSKQELDPNKTDGSYLNPNLALGQGALAAYYMFNALFSFGYTPLQGAYPTECLESTSRAKGMALSGVIVSLFGFINQFAGPIALGKIKNNYVFVFVGWDLVETAAWYFLGVETQGRTLEQLDDIFSAPYPVKKSKEMAKIAVKKAGDEVVVEQL